MEHLLGKIVKNDVVNSYGVTIVPAKSIINDEFMKLLLNHKISVDSIILAQDVPESIKPTASVHQAVNRTRQLFELISYTEEVPLEEISSEILPVIQQLSREPDVFQLIEAVKAKDNYTHEHNVGVAVLATLIGRWLNMSETELAILSLAAVLHDVGKVKIPIEILNKPGKLTDRELAVIRKHTIYGYEMLKATPELNQRVARVALQHHEREDGSGYPLGVGKDNIDFLSSIVAVADIFHAMSSDRPYRPAIAFHEIVTQMRQGKFGALNPHIVSIFLDSIMQKLVGRQVVLTDGRIGKVVYLNPHSIETPLIKVDNRFLDLSHSREIHIKEIKL